jgi:hypothetical protein
MWGCFDPEITPEWGSPQGRAESLEKDDLGVHVHLLILRKLVPPRFEFARIFDFPFHKRNITSRESPFQRDFAGGADMGLEVCAPTPSFCLLTPVSCLLTSSFSLLTSDIVSLHA